MSQKCLRGSAGLQTKQPASESGTSAKFFRCYFKRIRLEAAGGEVFFSRLASAIVAARTCSIVLTLEKPFFLDIDQGVTRKSAHGAIKDVPSDLLKRWTTAHPLAD